VSLLLTRLPIRLLLCAAALAASGAASAQSGLRAPQRDQPGLDPAFAGGWLVPTYDRFGFASQPWRDGLGFTPAPRPLSLFGRYWLSADWAVSAESMSRDAGGLLRLQDFRIGVQRRF
jgi:hypothetical protein